MRERIILKKAGFIILACMLFTSLVLAGCSSSDKGNGEGSAPSGKTVINVFAHQGSDTNLSTNKFTKKMEEKFDIQFNWTTVPFDGAAEKRQISLASGDYPTCICSSLG